jgi:hypothetical protein
MTRDVNSAVARSLFETLGWTEGQAYGGLREQRAVGGAVYFFSDKRFWMRCSDSVPGRRKPGMLKLSFRVAVLPAAHTRHCARASGAVKRAAFRARTSQVQGCPALRRTASPAESPARRARAGDLIGIGGVVAARRAAHFPTVRDAVDALNRQTHDVPRCSPQRDDDPYSAQT